MAPRLLDLPPELRIRIYGYVFTPMPLVFVRRGAMTTKLKDYRSHIAIERQYTTSTLLLNKMVHAESLPVLYQSCSFDFESMDLAQGFMKKQRMWLKNIYHVEIPICLLRRGATKRNSGGKTAFEAVLHSHCAQIATKMWNLRSVDLDIKVSLRPEFLIPLDIHGSWLYDLKSVRRVKWITAICELKRLEKLKNVEIIIKGVSEEEAKSVFMKKRGKDLIAAGAAEDAVHTMRNQWAKHYLDTLGVLESVIELRFFSTDPQAEWDMWVMESCRNYLKWKKEAGL